MTEIVPELLTLTKKIISRNINEIGDVREKRDLPPLAIYINRPRSRHTVGRFFYASNLFEQEREHLYYQTENHDDEHHDVVNLHTDSLLHSREIGGKPPQSASVPLNAGYTK